MIGAITAHLDRLTSRTLPLRARVPPFLFVALLCLFLAGYFVRENPEPNGDGRLAVTYAIVDRGTVAIDAYVAAMPRLLVDASEFDGHYYTARPPLPSFILAPLYLAMRLVTGPASITDVHWRWLMTLALSGTSLVVVVLVVWRLQRDLGLRYAGSPVAALVTATATPLVVYASLGLSHVFAAALLLGVLYCALRAPRYGVLSGVLFGALVATELVSALGAAIPFGWAVWGRVRSSGPRGVVAPILGAAAGSLAFPIYLLLAFGSPFADMNAYLVTREFRDGYAAGPLGLPSLEAVLALLVSPNRGLLVFAPIVALGIWRLVWLWRHEATYTGPQVAASRVAVGLSGAAALTIFLAISGYMWWHGGSSYGPRYLVPVLPLLCWSLATLPVRSIAAIGLLASLPQFLALAADLPLLDPKHLFPYMDYAMMPNTPTVLGPAKGWGAVRAVVPIVLVGAVYLSAARRPEPIAAS